MTSLPTLRPLDIRPIRHQGQPSWLVRDPLELCGQYMILPQALGPALMLCDGVHDIVTIQARLTSDYGLGIELAVVEELVTALDRACFLINERSRAAMKAAIEAYRAAPFRPPTIAGRGYPAEAEALREVFDGYLQAAGDVPAMPASGRAIFSPHIDYDRGSAVYARLWKGAREMARAAERVVILATDHNGGFNPLTLTRQDYATPYGILPTSQEVVDDLVDVVGVDMAFAGELYHQQEHSIELVITWLHHMRQGQAVELVPILIGSFHPYLEGHTSPEKSDLLQAFTLRLREWLRPANTILVASGDLAHVGPAFGGKAVGVVERADVREFDERMIGLLTTGDAEGFWQFIQAEGDRTNVCGVSPFYLSLKALSPVEGHRSGYAMCPADDANTSLVSICGLLYG